MSERRRGLGRGLGALIPTEGMRTGSVTRPSDMFFLDDAQRQAGGAVKHPGRNADTQEGVEAEDSAPASAPAAAPEGSTDSTVSTGEHLVDGLSPVPGAEFALIPLDEIRPNPRQPRSVFDEEQLDELVHSIREIGLLQPVVVRPLKAEDGLAESEAEGTGRPAGDGKEAVDAGGAGVRYELIMGERRWRASREAGLTEIPAIVKDTPDDAMLRDALLENLHRSQLNPLEEAAAYQQLLEDFGCTHEVLADRLGRSRPQITNTIRLLKLPPLVGRRVAAGVLSAGHARALLRLDDPAAMERLAQRIVAEGLSVRSVEEIVSLQEAGGDEPRRRPSRAAARPQPELENLASFLADRLETRVSIKMGRRNGKLTVEFASTEDLQRILDAIGESAPLGSEQLASQPGDSGE